jgi:hypothetical protein
VKKYKSTGSKRRNVNQISKIIQETIDAFAKENLKEGAEGLEELAVLYKSANISKSGYLELVEHIESEAVRISGDRLLPTKIKVALQERVGKKPIMRLT